MKSEKELFVQQLLTNFPNLKSFDLENLVSEKMISPFSIELPRHIVQQAQEFIQDIFSLRESAKYLKYFESLIQEKGLQDPGNKSIMMSYDFHVTENQQIKLIEINTNAAFLILGHQMYLGKGIPFPIPDFSTTSFKEMIIDELRLQKKDILKPSVVITDDNPLEQKMYLEFLVYQELFRSFGWETEIRDYREIFKNSVPDFIYNRHTDFFLEQNDSQEMRRKFLSKEVCLSPNPFEYLLLADKQRMMDWRKPGFLDQMGITNPAQQRILSIVPGAYDLTSATADSIWSQKKNFFVKPKNAFGSKQSYRAGSMSRKLFESLLDQHMIAQEFVPAGEQEFETPEGLQKFKYDLRCYVYQGKLQNIVARIYQGQVTNMRTPYGGFAPVTIT